MTSMALFKALQDLGVKGFLTQVPVKVGETVEDKVIVDFYFPQSVLVVEVNGSLSKRAKLESLGYVVLSYSDSEIEKDADRIAREIRAEAIRLRRSANLEMIVRK